MHYSNWSQMRHSFNKQLVLRQSVLRRKKCNGNIHWNVQSAQRHHNGAESATNVAYDSKTKPKIPNDSRKPQAHNYFWHPRIFGFYRYLATPGTKGIRRSKGTDRRAPIESEDFCFPEVLIESENPKIQRHHIPRVSKYHTYRHPKILGCPGPREYLRYRRSRTPKYFYTRPSFFHTISLSPAFTSA
jgi:hypothetical protein